MYHHVDQVNMYILGYMFNYFNRLSSGKYSSTNYIAMAPTISV
jgi:hypothetical protein